jgi:hypothetical protein
VWTRPRIAQPLPTSACTDGTNYDPHVLRWIHLLLTFPLFDRGYTVSHK